MLLSDVIQDPYVRLSDFLEILMVSRESVSFWGTKSLSCDGHSCAQWDPPITQWGKPSESVSLDEFASRFIEVCQREFARSDYNITSRRHGLEAVNILRRYYESTDNLEWETSIITVIIAVFKKFISFLSAYCWNICDPLYDTRWRITQDNGLVNSLQQMTPDQFKSAFRDMPIPASKQFSCLGSTFYIVNP